jgi:putative transposase
LKFGPDYARRFKRKRPSRRDIWHLDEVVVTISGQKHWLWRAVDQDGYVLDEIVQTRRDTKAAKRLLKRLLRKQGCPPRRIITDKLGSYAAARCQIMPEVEHRSHKGLNNRAENSHLPFRRRETMKIVVLRNAVAAVEIALVFVTVFARSARIVFAGAFHA